MAAERGDDGAPDLIDLVGEVRDVDRLRVALIRLSRRIRTQSTGELTPSQLAVLGTILAHQPVTNREIADHEHVRPPTTSRVVDALARAGLVERVPDPDDRRRVQVSATPAGQAFAADVRAAGRTWLAEQIDTLRADEVRALEVALPALERLLVGESD